MNFLQLTEKMRLKLGNWKVIHLSWFEIVREFQIDVYRSRIGLSRFDIYWIGHF